MKSTRIGFLAIILCSCSVGGLDSTESVGIPATFKVAGMESRTAIGERNASGARPISWEKGDAVRIFCENGADCEAVSEASGERTSLSAVLPAESTRYWAVYPYSAASSFGASALLVTIPGEQNRDFSDSHFAVSCTTDSERTFSFHNICSWLRFTVDGDGVSSVVLKGNGGERLVGDVSVSFSGTSMAEVACQSEGVSMVTKTVNGSGEYYIALDPGIVLKDGFSLELYSNSEKVRTIVADKALVIGQGSIKNIGVISSVSNGIGGTVRVDGVPRSGVAVSDGRTVVITDENGEYHIASPAEDAMYVYYSIPADAKVEIGDNGLPCFFQRITEEKYRYDFNLTGIPVENSFRLLALGDIQVKHRTENNGLERLEKETVPDIREYVASKEGNMPTYAITMGDLVHNRWNLFSDVLSCLAADKLGIPCFQTIGNHDHEFKEDGSVSDRQGQKAFESHAGPVNYSFDRGNIHIAVLDDIIHGGVNEKDITVGLSDEVRRWLTADLANVPKTKGIVLCMHADIIEDNNLYGMLKSFASYRVICGHEHYIINTSHKGVPVSVVGSINGVDWEGTVCGAGEPNGYASFEFSGTVLRNHIYKAVNHPEGYQMRMYRPDDFKDKEFEYVFDGGTTRLYRFGIYGSDKIVANIFNAKDSWKSISIMEDGEETGSMTKFTERGTKYDLWSCWYYLKRANRSTISFARASDHMYYGTLRNPDAADVRIRAVDTYGNVFEQSRFTGPWPDDYPDVYRKDRSSSIDGAEQYDYIWTNY